MEKKYDIKLEEILRGWGKLVKIKFIKNDLSEKEKEIVAERLKTCNTCPNRTRLYICKSCGCFLPAKVVLMNQKCIENKWSH
ncbi:MAG: hypothetical protein WC346_10625 [Methanogenium sp.]|jgi:hypothetical protein